MNLKEKREWIRKLKPYWKEYEKIEKEFLTKIRKLEEKMNKELKTEFPLEFFFVDGVAAGIGVERFEDRKKFPLIHDSELGG